jgi:hypothetical protein
VADGVQITVRGAREVQRALAKLPVDARLEMRRSLGLIAGRLTQAVRAAGRSDSKQSAQAAETVRSQVRDLNVVISAGPHELLFGSEFGVKRRFGWYAKPRYRRSKKRQFRPHLGAGSYWFFRAEQERRPETDRQIEAVADRVISRWSA